MTHGGGGLAPFHATNGHLGLCRITRRQSSQSLSFHQDMVNDAKRAIMRLQPQVTLNPRTLRLSVTSQQDVRLSF